MNDWQRCRPYIEAAVYRTAQTVCKDIQSGQTEQTLFTIEDIEHGISEKRMQFWPGRHSAGITQVEEHGSRVDVHLLFAGGRLGELLAMAASLEVWARVIGADRVVFHGRRGWQRVMAKRGYRLTGDDEMALEVNHG